MKIPKYRIVYTSPEGVSTTLTEVYSIDTRYGIESIKDSFKFNIIDESNKYNILPNGRVKIYLNYNGETENIVMDGLISEIKNNVGEKKNQLSVSGYNVLEILLNHQVRADYQTTSASSIVQRLIQAASDGQPADRQLTWDTGNDVTTKTVNFVANYRPVFNHIEALSADGYTGDGQFIYYVDTTTNKFIWKKRPNTVSSTINYGTDVLSLDRTRNPDEVVNFMIVNAGKDINNSSIHTYVMSPQSIGKLGWRTKYEVREDYSNYAKLFYGTGGNSTLYLTDGTRATTNAQFRTFVIDMAKQDGERILSGFEDGTDKVSIKVNGSTAYNAGQLYQINLPHAGWNETNQTVLRLREYSHTFNKNGWITSLEFAEDTAI